MKLPTTLVSALERLGTLILHDELSYDEAVDDLEQLVGKAEFSLFVRDVLRRFLRGQLKAWITQHLNLRDEEDGQDGQMTLPFPDLPRLLEIAPGTFKHQRAMTPRDWKAAVVQAKTKSDNASNYYARVQRAADLALALLGDDDNLTLQAFDSPLDPPQ